MVKIVTDTTAGLPRRLTAELGIPVLPQIVVFGEETYRDDTELDTATFLAKLRAAQVLPTTAAPPPALFTPIFRRYIDEGHSVICLHPSSEVSGTVRGATIAAQDFPGADIRVIDTRSIAGPLAAMVLAAHGWAQKGLGADEVEKRVRDMIRRQSIYFLVDTLENLQKGGRIGGAKALVGGLLQVKPILMLRDGRVEAFEQQRTKKRAMARIVELVVTECPRSNEAHLSVMHADALTEGQALAAELRAAHGTADIPIYELPPAIVVHGGPGVLAVSFFKQSA
jgi:fatty acid kinase fatty acid binding subunit